MKKTRILVMPEYDENGNLTLTSLEEGEENIKIFANTCFDVGNSMGGYFACSINYAGRKMLAIHTVTGAQKGMDPQKLKRMFAGKKGVVIKPGIKILWATTSGSARNGIFHYYREPKNVLERTLHECGCSPRGITYVSEIGTREVCWGGDLCKHQTQGGFSYHVFETDGEFSLKKKGGRVEVCEINQYHIGCQAEEDVYIVSGGTYLIEAYHTQSQWTWSSWPTAINSIYITKDADLDIVSRVIKKIFDLGSNANYYWEPGYIKQNA